MASPVLTLCLQEAKRASGATFTMEFGFRAMNKESAAKDRISICQSLNLAKVQKRMQRESRNFDDPVGISSEHEIIVTENECSGATPVDVSALEEPQRDADRGRLKNYRNC